MAEQTKKASLVEAVVNQVIEWGSVLFLLQAAAAFHLWLFGLANNRAIPFYMFAIGILRLYVIRRAANWITNRTRSES